MASLRVDPRSSMKGGKLKTKHGFLHGVDVEQSGKEIVFFRPVDKNYSHLTLLGDAIRKFDFVAQTFSVVSVETDNVVLGPAFGDPVLVRLSHLTYDELSKNLLVWEHGEAGYHVIQEMSLWLQVFAYVCFSLEAQRYVGQLECTGMFYIKT